MAQQPPTCHCWLVFSIRHMRRDEKLFLEYKETQKQRAVPRFLIVGLLLQMFTALVPGEMNYVFAYTLTTLAIILNSTLLILHHFIPKKRVIIGHLAWLVLWAQLLLTVMRRHEDAFNELLGWAVLLQFLTFATMPFPFVILAFYSLISMVAYMLIQYWNHSTFGIWSESFYTLQDVFNGVLLVITTYLGFIAYLMYENLHKRSFGETKKSLRDKLTIDQQSKEQERLLLSVLPEHVAVQMRKDLGQIDTQFKKIYMSRHENVSILYADIVGFTAISSTYSAQDLVAILNELFARFDRLAEKYQQLRIKILGDCYYCISGAPVERPDHAVLCVHMGLSMVKAIKYVQQTTNSPVDMRVGIHTGAVLAGVLGQRQWQFDVYSRDVELANKMESSGMAGRVHVSEVTLGFLKDEFEVEPAFGEKREEMLRQAGIKTYFIVKVLKPFDKGEDGDEDRGDTMSDLRDEDEDSVLSGGGEEKETEDKLIYDMLQEELRNRDDNKELASAGICLGFEYEAERQYLRRGEKCPAPILQPSLALIVPLSAAALCFLPPRPFQNTYIYYMLTASVTCFIFYASYRWKVMKKKDYNPEYRVYYSLINMTGFLSASIYTLYECGDLEERRLSDHLRSDAIQHSGAARCDCPSYYYHMEALALCCVLFMTPASCARRMAVLALSATAHLLPSMLAPALLFPRQRRDNYPYYELYLNNGTLAYEFDQMFDMQSLHRNRHFIMLFLIAIAICIYDRYLEALERARHLRGERMRQQAEQAGDLRRRNQALVYNVLPPHVARHFMGAHRSHRDLYSQSYAEVGVLFASMPNFTEFYSEETVNNQGLECLRFLNEVISDFDSLLEEPRFRDIIKIKTISSTYMAASGLNPKQNFKNADATVMRWNHLMCLVEFALELQRVLAAINEQSFNHFVLRMGVNHGPITAGVIGAKKPHYDIWGNTVNVASRMESTGKAGCIQVTEETCHILEDFGYYFEQRGLVAVKGKGQLMTYYLQGRNLKPDQGQTPPTADEKAETDQKDNGCVKVVITNDEHVDEESVPKSDEPLLEKPEE